MELTNFFIAVTAIAIVWFIVSGGMIVNELMKRNQKIKFIIINMMLPVYIQRYKKITLEETGKIGALYYHAVIAVNTALFFAVATIILKNS